MRFHLDTDFLIYAVSVPGPERQRLGEILDLDSDDEVGISAVAWYEFARGPRTAEQLAVARSFFETDGGVIPFSEELAMLAAECFRLLGHPRKRGADIAIGVTAVENEAVLLTRNARDFAKIPGLRLETVIDA